MTARDLCTTGAHIPVEGGAGRSSECQRAMHVTEKNNTRAKGSDGRGDCHLVRTATWREGSGKARQPGSPDFLR